MKRSEFYVVNRTKCSYVQQTKQIINGEFQKGCEFYFFASMIISYCTLKYY